MRAAGASIDVLVEVDVGAHRCGVLPGAPALELARAIAGESGLRFAGLHAYQGAAQHAATGRAARGHRRGQPSWPSRPRR
jgi:D-serine deaminase-like pyridoxal phosphate-dependent protein